MPSEDTTELSAALPGYEIGGELGRGAFGVVLAGRHRQLGRQVAIKRLPRSFSDHAEVRHRFSAEAKILASLDHPHIVPIFDYVEQDGLCLLVMELLPGGSVRQWLASGLSAQAACAITLATCSALDYAHQRGVLHRDVKPDNLLFTGAGLLKVTDFGIAKVVGDVAVTQIGETPGTPLYMAPEQCLNQTLSPATDVYSTGIMLYEMLARENPFAGSGDVVSTMYRQVHEDVPPLSSVLGADPGNLSPVVMRALAKDPSARYRSARAFGGALAEAATEAWGGSWPAGDALRIMSVGPIEAATGWPLTTGPIAVGFHPDDHNHGGATTRVAGSPSPPVAPWSPSGAVAPSLPTPVAPPLASWDPPAPGYTQAHPYPPAALTTPNYAAGDTAYDDEYPRALPPGTPRSARHPVRWVAPAAVLIAILVVGGVVALTGKRATSPPPTAATTVPSKANPTQVAADLSQLIQQSSNARIQVVNTVAAIEKCSADPQSAASSLAAAVSTRQQVVSRLAAQPVDALPNGAAMRAAMTTALNDSVDADHHFEAWLAGITAAGGCSGQAPHDTNWQAAEASSNAASGAKQTFATLWNPVAATYSLPKVTSATI